MPMTKTVLRSFVICLTSLLTLCVSAQTTDNKSPQIKPYIAQYKLFRSGEEHGTAERQLIKIDDKYQLRYQSSLEWMIFSDERFESSLFTLQNNRVKPLEYQMERKGTGPDRSYKVVFDRENREIKGPKKRSKKKRKKEGESMVLWNDNWLDPISYQQQLYFDLHAGLDEFFYVFINRKGKEHSYHFKLTGKEQLILPYGTVEAVKVERIYENSERQTIAWFAPQLDYALVRIWKGKAGVEQFDLQLKSIN